MCDECKRETDGKAVDPQWTPSGYEETEDGEYKYTVLNKRMLEIKNRFTYHSPKAGQPNRYYTYLRNCAKQLAITILEQTPESREQALALTKLEEAIMWANASIARNEK